MRRECGGERPTSMEVLGLLFMCVWYAVAAIFLFFVGLTKLIFSLFTVRKRGRHGRDRFEREANDVWRYGY